MTPSISPNIKTRTYLNKKARNCVKVSAAAKPLKSPANKNNKITPTIDLCNNDRTAFSKEDKATTTLILNR